MINLKEGCPEDEARLFLVMPGNKMKGNRSKLKHRKFYLNMMKNFAVRVTEHWNGLPQRGCGVFFPGDIQEPSEHNPE